ncbi:hypothetical protein BKA65DRAFT_557331 [Rhexocercosporidium sp. MPI-PUGE-AT-0058]|nr:hypothetical protein BKA65DRAFT_557331 [Rhexocercosporidium sp. MPI-PUGE-AT-0058]
MAASPGNGSLDIGVCKDSPFSTASSVLSIITFFYAVALGSYIVIKATRESNDKFEQIIRATEYTKLELAVSRQNFEKSEDGFHGGRFGRESDRRVQKNQKDQMQHLIEKASLQFEKSDTILEAFRMMFPDYDERRSKEWGFFV